MLDNECLYYTSTLHQKNRLKGKWCLCNYFLISLLRYFTVSSYHYLPDKIFFLGEQVVLLCRQKCLLLQEVVKSLLYVLRIYYLPKEKLGTIVHYFSFGQQLYTSSMIYFWWISDEHLFSLYSVAYILVSSSQQNNSIYFSESCSRVTV